jgi:hypothetical protein
VKVIEGADAFWQAVVVPLMLPEGNDFVVITIGSDASLKQVVELTVLTVYDPGLLTVIDCVLPHWMPPISGLHTYASPWVEVSVILWPLQTAGDPPGVIMGLGFGFTVTKAYFCALK